MDDLKKNLVQEKSGNTLESDFNKLNLRDKITILNRCRQLRLLSDDESRRDLREKV